MDVDEASAWFVAEVLPHEPQLMRYLRRNWRDFNEVEDLRQEVYARVFDAAVERIPDNAQAFLMSVARNHLIDRARRGKVVSIETYAEIEAATPMVDELSPERHVASWTELKIFRAALQLLPPRCQEVVRLRKIQGMSQREVAQTMGITEDTVERQVSKGVRALADALGRGNRSSAENHGSRRDASEPKRTRR